MVVFSVNVSVIVLLPFFGPPKSVLTLLVRLQHGCFVTGPTSWGGVHDYRHGCESDRRGAALNLLYLSQKVCLTERLWSFSGFFKWSFGSVVVTHNPTPHTHPSIYLYVHLKWHIWSDRHWYAQMMTYWQIVWDFSSHLEEAWFRSKAFQFNSIWRCLGSCLTFATTSVIVHKFVALPALLLLLFIFLESMTTWRQPWSLLTTRARNCGEKCSPPTARWRGVFNLPRQ